jgi:gamma-glutamyltranspeptidase/glutathione hydrolase
MKVLKIQLLLLLGLFMLAWPCAQAGDRYTGEHFATRSPVLARNGIAATSHPIASSIAVDIMRKGGSAIDAAIAANAMLALVEPHACGIGGDLFAIVWDPNSKQLAGYNGSGRSPASLDFAEMENLLDGAVTIPLFGPLSVSVPGAVDAWFALHERYGKLPMSELLAPAIGYAREGVAITEVDAALWAEAMGELAEAGLPPSQLEQLYETFMNDSRPPRAGEIFKNPDLADSLARLADGGRDAFYKGDLAGRMTAAVQEGGGHLQLADLAGHRGEWVTPVSVNYRGYDVYEMPPNSQGIAALQMLNLLEAYPLAKMGRDSAEFWHVYIEAKKLAYEDRARFYADPAFAEIPLAWLLSDEYAEQRRKMIDPQQAAKSAASGSPPAHGDTTFLVTGDADGMMVSFIQSNYWEFGSGVVASGTGFALQNRGSSFSMEKDHANVYEAGKRPFHTIIPAFVMQGETPLMAFGVMGGYLQPQAHALIVMNIIDGFFNCTSVFL